MEPPSLPPVPAGQSALPAFLKLEAYAREQLDDADRGGAQRVDEAAGEAGRIRAQGEERLRQVVLDAERLAQQEVEDAARDRVSEARVRVQQWIEQAETAAQGALGDALDRLCGGV